jgi:hypothetical protein
LNKFYAVRARIECTRGYYRAPHYVSGGIILFYIFPFSFSFSQSLVCQGLRLLHAKIPVVSVDSFQNITIKKQYNDDEFPCNAQTGFIIKELRVFMHIDFKFQSLGIMTSK